MSKNIERWGFHMDESYECDCDCTPDEHGSYVLYRDHRSAIETLEREKAELYGFLRKLDKVSLPTNLTCDWANLVAKHQPTETEDKE